MDKERLQKLLAELGDELQDAGEVDAKTRKLLDELHDDIDRLTGEDHGSALARARRLESRLAAEYPLAERIAREFTDLLAKMGI